MELLDSTRFYAPSIDFDRNFVQFPNWQHRIPDPHRCNFYSQRWHLGSLENYQWNLEILKLPAWIPILPTGRRTIQIQRRAESPTATILPPKPKVPGSMKLQIGNPTVETSTVGLYHLEETSGTGAYVQDSSATNADGTPTGTTRLTAFTAKPEVLMDQAIT